MREWAKPASRSIRCKRVQRRPKGVARKAAQRFVQTALALHPAGVAFHDLIGVRLKAVMRPEKRAGTDARKLPQQAPRLRQMIQKAAAKNRVKPAKLCQLSALQIRLHQPHLSRLQQANREAGTRQIRGATFHAQHVRSRRAAARARSCGRPPASPVRGSSPPRETFRRTPPPADRSSHRTRRHRRRHRSRIG